MAELTVNPWRRQGKDRLYVNVAGIRGRDVAWLDCLTGVVEITDAAYEDAALEIIEEWCRTCGRSIPPRTVVGRASACSARPSAASQSAKPPAWIPALPSLTEDDDLARHQPGTGVQGMIDASEGKRKWLVRAVARLVRDDLTPPALSTGLDGERLVGGLLMGLKDAGWYVLHGVPLPSGADIDHVVIGPPGVFTVNTKHHPDASVWVGDKRVTVNRNSYPYIEKSHMEGVKTAALLHYWCGYEVPVQSVIAVVGARKLTHKGDPSVVVLDGAHIADALAARPAQLEPHRVASIYDVLRRGSVWRQFGRRSGSN